MAYEKDPYDLDKIPDYAMQPAREEDDTVHASSSSMHIDSFDPTIYERLFASMPPLDMEFEPHDLLPDSGSARSGAGEKDTPKKKAEDLDLEGTAEEQAAEAASDIPQELKERPAPRPVPEPIPEPTPETDIQVEDPTMPLPDEPLGEEIPIDDEPMIPEIPAVPTQPSLPQSPDEPLESFEPLEPTAPTGSVEPMEPVEPTEPFEPMEPETPSEPLIPEMPVIPEIPAPAKPSVPAEPQTPSVVTPAVPEVICSNLKMTDIRKKPQVRVFIEEDILVPDVKPDLSHILSMDGKLKLSDKEINAGPSGATTLKLTGDFMLQTLYIPERPCDCETIISIDSRLPFKEEMEIKAEPNSKLVVTPVLESIDYSVVNERKFRVKAILAICVKEYRPLEISLFEGIEGEELQLLKEKIRLSDVALRKTENFDLEEEMTLREGMPEIGKILRYDVDVVENHKQISREKAVINANVYCNIMYLPAEGSALPEGEELEEGAEYAYRNVPALYQGKTEFTQFIRLDDDLDPGQVPSCSNVTFHLNNAAVSAKEDEEGRMTCFNLNFDVDTAIELFKDVEKEIVTDAYHHVKEMQYDTDEVTLMSLFGTGAAEVSAREIINVPDAYEVEKVAFICGSLKETESVVESGKCVVEGKALLKLVCIAQDDDRTPFSMKHELPFRAAIDVPGVKPGMEADCDVVLSELWFDKINSRQIEVNATVKVSVSVASQEKHQMIKNVCFVEPGESGRKQPSIVLYITRSGDNIWKIAKKYRTTIDAICQVNNLEGSDVKPGTKLLIVK